MFGGSELVKVFEVSTAKSLSDAHPVPCLDAQPCRQTSPTYDSSGALSYRVDRNDAGRMVRLTNGQLVTLFSFSTDVLPPGVDLDATGTSAIWRRADSAEVVRWTFGALALVSVPGAAVGPSW